MDEALDRFKRFARLAGTAARRAGEALKASRSDDHEAAIEAARKALKALASMEETGAVVPALEAAMSELRRTSLAALEKRAVLVASELASILDGAGLEVTGNLPRLRAGVFTIEVRPGACTIWFGPGKYRLASCGMDAHDLAAEVLGLRDSLFRQDFDQEAFLADLQSAYRVTLARLGLGAGEPVPLTMLMAEVAFQGQADAFLADPRRENFRSYGRAAFAADLSRLSSWTLGPLELRLQVATLAQTRSPMDHLWVPDRGGVEGTNYSTARFVEAGR